MHRYLRCHFVIVTVVPRSTSEVISNSSIRRRDPGSPSPRPPYVVYPTIIACSMSAMPAARISGNDPHTGPLAVIEARDRDFATPCEPHDVASDLRDGRGDDGCLGTRETRVYREVASGLTSRDDVGVDSNRDPSLAVVLRTLVEQLLAHGGAEVAVEEVVPGIELALAPAITCRQRQEHRMTLRGGRLSVHLDQILDSKLRSRSVQLRNDRPRCGTEVVRHRLRVLSRDLVCHHEVPFLGR